MLSLCAKFEEWKRDCHCKIHLRCLSRHEWTHRSVVMRLSCQLKSFYHFSKEAFLMLNNSLNPPAHLLSTSYPFVHRSSSYLPIYPSTQSVFTNSSCFHSSNTPTSIHSSTPNPFIHPSGFPSF